jgi:hypothetical protein
MFTESSRLQNVSRIVRARKYETISMDLPEPAASPCTPEPNSQISNLTTPTQTSAEVSQCECVAFSQSPDGMNTFSSTEDNFMSGLRPEYAASISCEHLYLEDGQGTCYDRKFCNCWDVEY